MRILINVLLFQAAWFACVLGAAHERPWIGALTAGVVIAWHLTQATRAWREAALLGTAAGLGALFETMLVQLGWIRFNTGVLLEGTAPYWMVALWPVFATTLNVSLRSLRGYSLLAVLLGAIGGPAAYYAGSRLGALEFAVAGSALLAIGIGWAILTPLLFRAARVMDGYAQP
jgi:hypothetical protein